MQNVLKRKNMYFVKKSCYQKHFIKHYDTKDDQVKHQVKSFIFIP